MIENVDWQILSACNRRCAYCFGPETTEIMPLHRIKDIINALAASGVRQLGITGGEPLLHPNIEEILSHIHDQGMRIYLSTNCDRYVRCRDVIRDTVSIIGIPLDGADQDTHDSPRGTGSFDAVTHAIEDIHRSGVVKIKVGTVVTRRNINDLSRIGCLLKPFENSIHLWKLYEPIAYARNAAAIRRLRCPEELSRFDKAALQLQSEKIIIDTKEKRDRSYFFIRPDGKVFVPLLRGDHPQEQVIGDLLTESPSTVYRRFTDVADMEGCYQYYRYMRTEQGGRT